MATMPDRKPATAPKRAALVPWAYRELGLPSTSSREEVGLAVLDRLQSDNWLTTPALQFAFETLSQRDEDLRAASLPVGGGEHYYAAEKQAREVVDGLADDFFSMPPAARRERWTQLLDEYAAFPRVVHRLLSWEAGLDVPWPDFGADRPTADLAGQLGLMFTAAPARRVQLRLTPDERFASTAGQWPAAARKMKDAWPQIVALDSKYVSDLSWGLTSEAPQSAPSRRSAGPPPLPSKAASTTYDVDPPTWPHTTDDDSDDRRSADRAAASRHATIGVGVIAAIIFGLVRFGMQATTESQPTRPQDMRVIQTPPDPYAGGRKYVPPSSSSEPPTFYNTLPQPVQVPSPNYNPPTPPSGRAYDPRPAGPTPGGRSYAPSVPSAPRPSSGGFR